MLLAHVNQAHSGGLAFLKPETPRKCSLQSQECRPSHHSSHQKSISRLCVPKSECFVEHLWGQRPLLVQPTKKNKIHTQKKQQYGIQVQAQSNGRNCGLVRWGIGGSPQLEVWIEIKPVCGRIVAICFEIDTVRFLNTMSVADAASLENKDVPAQACTLLQEAHQDLRCPLCPSL